MFPRGPRFHPEKPSDVPGPNAYNPLDSPQDAYKRGAFIEKAERFSIQAPGLATCGVEPNMKSVSKPPFQTQDRYAILQRKLEDLERLHNDGKKAHQTEVDCLKAEITRFQQSNAELADRTDKLKKHNEALDVRLQDLKKAASSDQAEIKDLRLTLRTSEHERTHMSTKQGEAAELKKSLQSLESRRREEVKERDRRIAELEKAVMVEKRKREAAEAKHLELQAKGDEELLSSRQAAQKLEALVNTAQAETRDVQSALTSFKVQSECKEEALLAQLEQRQRLVGHVAEEYGRLVSRTVPISDHTRLKQEHTTLLVHTERLERKLARSQIQVVELTSMIRDANEQIQFLTIQLHEAEDDMSSYLVDVPPTSSSQSSSLETVYHAVHEEFMQWQNTMQKVETRSSELASDFYRLTCEQLLLAYSVVDKELQNARLASQQYAADLSSALASHEAIAACLETAQKEQRAADERLKTATELTDELRSSSDLITRQLRETEENMRLAAVSSGVALTKEQDTVQRLTNTVQKCRMAEDALRSEIELLTTELTVAEKYQEAYYSLSNEVESLVARNQLAEDEARRLSKFNTEILSHNNPAQRIMYVDRIRRELAETKHKLIMLTRERETVVAENGELQHELDMYKSVMVPVEHRPRTNITRVARAPLTNLTQCLNTGNVNVSAAQLKKSHLDAGDMILEEIL